MKKLGQKSIYKDAWVELFQDTVELPNGTTGTYAWVNRKNGVAVVVISQDQRILLQKEYRYVIAATSWEIPGGGIDLGEAPITAAVRELQEETGLVVSPTSLEKLGEFYPLNSFNTELVTVFLAKGVSQAAATDLHTRGMEASEVILEQRWVSFTEALEMIDAGQISDALTAAVVQMAVRRVTNEF